MSVDERLFGWLHRRISAWAGRESAAVRAESVDSQAHLNRLRALAAVGAGYSVDVRLVEGLGGLTPDSVLLPARFFAVANARENLEILKYRATLAGALVREIGKLGEERGAALERALPLAIERLSEELPGWAALGASLPGELPRSATIGELFPSLGRPALTPENTAQDLPAAGRSERMARRRPPPTRWRKLSEQAQQDNPFTHSFEKVHTAEERPGGNKRADGSDEMAEHGAALDELELDEVVLANEATRSVYQAELGFGVAERGEPSADVGPRCYDEWDAAKRRYLPRHCRVSEEEAERSAASGLALRRRLVSEGRRTIAGVRGELMRLDSALRWHTRQADGPEIDLDAVVERQAELVAGHDSTTRLHVSKRRRGHSLALHVLLDLSMSTDGWVDDRRIFDVQREAVALFALGAEDLITELTLSGFCSFSRHDCRFVLVKRATESLEVGFSRLARLEPRGYTRVGPALRHATNLLCPSPARRRAVVLVSDGKPSDADAYEGRRGLGDVRQAVREARQRGVEIFALAADPRSRALLPQMFGAKSYAALRDAASVAGATAAIVAELSKR